MIYGIGTDIVKISRFEKWEKDGKIISRFFNDEEIVRHGTKAFRCQHYASRFAVKEAFSKALGTGIVGFALSDVYVTKGDFGEPLLHLEGKAAEIFEQKCGSGAKIFVSISHEKEYALATAIIEII